MRGSSSNRAQEDEEIIQARMAGPCYPICPVCNQPKSSLCLEHEDGTETFSDYMALKADMEILRQELAGALANEDAANVRALQYQRQLAAANEMIRARDVALSGLRVTVEKMRAALLDVCYICLNRCRFCFEGLFKQHSPGCITRLGLPLASPPPPA